MCAETATSPTAILIVSYNGLKFLPDCLASIFASPDAPPPEWIVIVDNASTDGSWDWLQQHYCAVTRLRLETNTGFVGGNNAGFALIKKQFPQMRYVALLNQDTIVTSGWLRELVRTADADTTIASVQSKLRLHPDTSLINSAGNESHYLGFGFVSGYRQRDSGQFDGLRDLAYCSGAAMLLRASALERKDLLDPAYFAYLEDAELGWYFRIRGLRNTYCPTSLVYHRYQFTRNPQTYYLLERNRWRLLLTYYRWPTLILLLPIIAAMEAGLTVYFLKVRALREKLGSWDVVAEHPGAAENLRPRADTAVRFAGSLSRGPQLAVDICWESDALGLLAAGSPGSVVVVGRSPRPAEHSRKQAC